MRLLTSIQCVTLFFILSLFGCTGSSTTDGQPNRGGPVTTDDQAEKQRGGNSADWAEGTGRPGTAPSPIPTNK
jgi:hypothetical protein